MMKKLAVLCFLFAALAMYAGDGQALYPGAHLVGTAVSGVMGILLWMSRSKMRASGCYWLPLLGIMALALYLLATNGGTL